MTVKISATWKYIIYRGRDIHIRSGHGGNHGKNRCRCKNGDVITLTELNSAFEPFEKRIQEGYKGPDKEKS